MNFVIITNVYQTNSICFAVYVYRNVILILPFESYFYLKYQICFPRIKLTLQMFFCLFLTYFIFKSTHSALFPNFFFLKLNTMLCLTWYQLMWTQHPFLHRTKTSLVQLKIVRQELWLGLINWEKWRIIVQIPFSNVIKHRRLNKQFGVNEFSDICSMVISFSMAFL